MADKSSLMATGMPANSPSLTCTVARLGLPKIHLLSNEANLALAPLRDNFPDLELVKRYLIAHANLERDCALVSLMCYSGASAKRLSGDYLGHSFKP